MSQPSYGEDEFFRRVNAQVRKDHTETRERNQRKKAVWAQAPAMQLASSLLRGPFGTEPETEGEYAEMLDRFAESLLKEPLIRRYQNHLGQSRLASRANTEWWHALGHQYTVALEWTAAQTRAEAAAEKPQTMPVIFDERLWMGDAFKDVGPREMAFEWAGRTMEAKTYLWTQYCLDAALSAPLVPHVVQPNALPFESLFFSFEFAGFVNHTANGGLENDLMDQMLDQTEPGVEEFVSNEVSETGPLQINGKPIPTRHETWWVMCTQLGDAGMMINFDRQYWPEDGVSYVPQQHHIFEPVQWGARWPEDFTNRPFKAVIGAVLRMLAFMQAPFVDTTLMERRLPRPIRREYDRAEKQAPVKEVSIITLRKALYEPMYPNGDDHEVVHGRYSHSWWVEGHYRWQWYPSEKTHKLIAIAPYMKQVGKPLLPQIRVVSR